MGKGAPQVSDEEPQIRPGLYSQKFLMFPALVPIHKLSYCIKSPPRILVDPPTILLPPPGESPTTITAKNSLKKATPAHRDRQ